MIHKIGTRKTIKNMNCNQYNDATLLNNTPSQWLNLGGGGHSQISGHRSLALTNVT